MIAKRIATLLLRSGVELPLWLTYDFARWATLRTILRQSRINCVIDVGANRGQFASTLRDVGFTGRIISFEPAPLDFAILSDRFSRDRMWRGVNCALGDRDGELPLNYLEDSTALSSFVGLKQSSRRARTITVRVQRLDSIYRTILAGIESPRVFLKCDTQGFDYEVVSGAEGVIENVLGIQSEVTVLSAYYENVRPYYQNLERYEQLGFRLMGMFGGGRYDIARCGSEYDCIMARIESFVESRRENRRL